MKWIECNLVIIVGKLIVNVFHVSKQKSSVYSILKQIF